MIRGFARKVMGPIGMVSGAIAGIAGGVGLGIGVKLAAEAEQAEVAFTTIMGSAEDAKEMIEGLEQFAATTPFQLPGVQNATRQLMAMGFSAQEVMPMLQSIGDVASSLGMGEEGLTRIGRALNQMRAKTRVSAEEMMQLAEAGVPAWQLLADTLGVTVAEARKMSDRGQMDAETFIQAFANMEGPLAKFRGGMEAQSQTISGLFSTLKDNTLLSLRDLAAGMMDALDVKSMMQGLIETAGFVRESVVPVIVRGFQWMVETVVPIIRNLVSTVWSGVQTISEFLFPVVMGWWGAFKAAFGMIWDITSSVFGAIVDAIGPVGESFGWIGGLLTTLRDGWTMAYLAMEFAFENWRDLVALGMLKVGKFFVDLKDSAVWVFRDVIPGLLGWLGRNWKSVFTDIASYVSTVVTNMFDNVVNFFQATWDWLSGNEANFEWKSLTEGFESSLEELPSIAKRHESELARTMGDSIGTLEQNLSTGFEEHVKNRMSEIEGQKDAIKNMFRKDDSGPELPDEKPKFPGMDSKSPKKDGADAQSAEDALAADVGGSQQDKAQLLGLDEFWKRMALGGTTEEDPGKQTSEHTGEMAKEAKEQTKQQKKSTELQKTMADILQAINEKATWGYA